MLVLSRKVKQKIMIGDDIEVSIADVKGNQVQIGIKAPKEIPVYRKELYYRIKRREELEAKNSDI